MHVRKIAVAKMRPDRTSRDVRRSVLLCSQRVENTHSVHRVHCHLILRSVADETLSIGETHIRGSCSVTLVICNDLDAIILPHSHTSATHELFEALYTITKAILKDFRCDKNKSTCHASAAATPWKRREWCIRASVKLEVQNGKSVHLAH
jgi:hypothetical protein